MPDPAQPLHAILREIRAQMSALRNSIDGPVASAFGAILHRACEELAHFERWPEPAPGQTWTDCASGRKILILEARGAECLVEDEAGKQWLTKRWAFDLGASNAGGYIPDDWGCEPAPRDAATTSFATYVDPPILAGGALRKRLRRNRASVVTMVIDGEVCARCAVLPTKDRHHD